MVTYNTDDVITIADFAFAWRITDAQWEILPPESLAQITPLSKERSKEIAQKGRRFRDAKMVREYQISDYSFDIENSSNAEKFQSWLTGLPVRQDLQLYVSWGYEDVIVTTWSFFINHWGILWYPFDAIDVFDETREWAFLLGPEEVASFLIKK